MSSRRPERYNRGVSSRETRKLTVTCPDCGANMTIDAATGQILAHKKRVQPPAGGRELEEMLADLETERARAEEIFEQSKSAVEDEDRLLEEKFKEALKRAREEPDDEPPPRPWDLD